MGNKFLKIGIPTNLRDKRFGTHGNYIEWVAQFGQPILLTPGIDQYDQFDALFLPGGKDVNSANLTFLQGPSDPHLEWFDATYINRCFRDEKPIFGVCRGMQTINSYFGGTLRNLYGDALKLSNKCSTEEEKNTRHEEITIVDKRFQLDRDSLLPSEKKLSIFRKVNSIHHQVVDKLAEDFKTVAISEKYLHDEAIIHKNNKVAAVQYHPEKINDQLAKDMFNFILKK